MLSFVFIPPLFNLVGHYIIPRPGSGPSESEMDKGYLKLTGVGEGEDG